MNTREDRIEMYGIVTDVLPAATFKVTCESINDAPGVVVHCTLGGKLRMNKIRVLLQDQVKIEVSPYDMSRGRIVWRK